MKNQNKYIKNKKKQLKYSTAFSMIKLQLLVNRNLPGRYFIIRISNPDKVHA